MSISRAELLRAGRIGIHCLPIVSSLHCRFLGHELGFGQVDCGGVSSGCRLQGVGLGHLANAKGAIGTQDGVWLLWRLNRGVVPDIRRNCERKIVLQRVARDKPVSIHRAFGVSLKSLNQMVRPDAVHQGIAGVGLLVR